MSSAHEWGFIMEVTIYVLMALFAGVIYFANVNDKIQPDGVVEEALEDVIEDVTGADIDLSPDSHE